MIPGPGAGRGVRRRRHPGPSDPKLNGRSGAGGESPAEDSEHRKPVNGWCRTGAVIAGGRTGSLSSVMGRPMVARVASLGSPRARAAGRAPSAVGGVGADDQGVGGSTDRVEQKLAVFAAGVALTRQRTPNWTSSPSTALPRGTTRRRGRAGRSPGGGTERIRQPWCEPVNHAGAKVRLISADRQVGRAGARGRRQLQVQLARRRRCDLAQFAIQLRALPDVAQGQHPVTASTPSQAFAQAPAECDPMKEV